MNHNEEIPDNLGRLGDLLPADVLEKYKGSIVFNIYEKGSLHVDHVDSQNFYGDSSPKPMKGPKQSGESATKPFDTDTPLSALFRENHHEELRKVIESWRPFLTGVTENVMKLNEFKFDLSRIQPSTVYLDLAQLINQGGLQCSMSVLATYMFSHSNLSRSENALYVQLKRYKKLSE